ncbi:MAG: hypothetical protein H7Z19_06680 [Chitinophagaceae bacterium]|nr:hypothetical protein [Rubrivivax sp.]
MSVAESTTLDTAALDHTEQARYARCIEVSQRVRWDIDRDVLRGRGLDADKHFLPAGLARLEELDFLDAAQLRRLNQVQGRTYANMFGCVERFIGAKMLQITNRHWFGSQVALQALVRFTDEELKHQELFRRIEALAAQSMPEGYRFQPDPDVVAAVVMAAPTWAVLALTCHIELFTQVHYRSSIEPDPSLSALYKDVFFFHWKEESQHAVIDELEWRHEDTRLTAAERDSAVDALIGLVAAVDSLLVMQAQSDTRYFCSMAGDALSAAQATRIGVCLLRAYRWQYIGSGVQSARFQAVLGSMTSEAQRQRIATALAPLMV